jgi:[ribosomal protein S5]-alanine N-acetyltransferase
MPGVKLRTWRDEDAPAIQSMTDDPHIKRWSSMETDVQAWIARQRAGTRGPSLAICTMGNNRALGKIAVRLPGHASPATSCAAIRPSDHTVGELSYWLLPEAWGRGLAAAAVQTMLRLVAADTDLRSVVLDVEETNRPSTRLAQRLGADRRQPSREVADRAGVLRTMAVFVLPEPRPDALAMDRAED